MNLSIEKAIWRSRMQEKTKALGHSEKRLHHFRRSVLANGTLEYRAPNEVLARERYNNENEVTAWDDTKLASALTETRCIAIKKQGRRRQPSLKALNEEIDKYWEVVLKGTATERNVCLQLLKFAYEMKDEMMSTLGSKVAMDPDSASTHGEAAVASSQKNHLRETMSQTARSATDSRATEHRSTHDDDRFRSRGCSKVDVTRLLGNSMSNRPMRVRANHSDNTFLLKRRRHREKFFHKIRAQSEPYFRKNRLDRHENVAGGSEKAVHHSQLNTSVLPSQKPLPSTNRNARAQSVDPRERRVSSVQDEDLSVRKSLKSRTHSPGTRSSERLLQPRKRATRLQNSVKSLQNRVTKRRQSSNESDRTGTTISMRLRSSMRRTTRSKKPDLPNGSETASRSKTAQATDKRTVSDVSKEKLPIRIPADTRMATSLRGYSQWPGKSRNIALVNLDLTTLSR